MEANHLPEVFLHQRKNNFGEELNVFGQHLEGTPPRKVGRRLQDLHVDSGRVQVLKKFLQQAVSESSFYGSDSARPFFVTSSRPKIKFPITKLRNGQNFLENSEIQLTSKEKKTKSVYRKNPIHINILNLISKNIN